ncbi:hypothetical protein FJV41_01540 [Myxococcus llanfairpwllgwyngyllgogerychwyrndrobwllllantysiliogogogochensis]|uniref:Uncharacterized protein n=1 Tax=Myxococcus llanfairpwllgwyngyllgogerychwyrndrobwllllantysiliogogogochensis TaxID=2590453 RepID=A0A540X8X9_9BACT|nr:hypothetical protein [Myxococcus llanfairpwllgwyngyllgogerychwyrndrobwllllantysiliogogogochensis]TQF17680.1 hypothetical protein FJV41_01540 [Myxococcus llanfairpwllgwyngyllgogerychwyrndrobwllllantysiliogogogochensis]
MAGNADHFERALAAKRVNTRTVMALTTAVRAGEAAMLRSDETAYKAAHEQTLKALRALSPEELRAVESITTSMQVR